MTQAFKLVFPPRITAAFLVIALGSAAFGDPPVVPGVANFHQVDDHVYRGAQPTAEGLRNLAKLGIKVVVDLRQPGQRSLDEEKEVTDAGMRYVEVPMKGMHRPSNDSVFKVLNLLEDKSKGPVFVHCMRGADRTGDVIACYRIEHDHWSNTQALAEARSLGMSWYQKAIQHYVLSYRPRLPDSVPTVQAASAINPAAASAQQ